MDLSERSCAHVGEVIEVACDLKNTLMISAGYYGDIKVHLPSFDNIMLCVLLLKNVGDLYYRVLT